jgi:hypothetical protein
MKNRNEKALKIVAIALAAMTYAGAVMYGDIQFLQVMDKAFPNDGVVRALAIAGAVMTAVSALTLPLALHWWFSPGLQFLWGITFWVLDILALGLNAILAYQIAVRKVDSMLVTWQMISPATPLLAVVGWGLAFLLDPSHKERHAIAEMQADQIDTYAEQMRQAAKSEEVYAEILVAAKLQAREFAHSLHGQRVANVGTSNANNGTPESTSSKRGTTAKINATPELVPVKSNRNGHGDTAPLA